MYKIAICDDQQNHIDKIKKIIDTYFIDKEYNYSIQQYTDGYSLLDSIKQIDILFLDIEMPGIKGIEVKEKITRWNCKIIFVTNYDQRMNEAFGRNVLAFIKKDELFKITDILSKIEKEDNEHKIINISNQMIDTYEIMYIKASGSYIYIYTTTKEYFYCMYLSHILEKVNSYNFLKVHRSYVVNMRYIKDINSKELILKDNTHIPIARQKKEEVTNRFFQYIRENR